MTSSLGFDYSVLLPKHWCVQTPTTLNLSLVEHAKGAHFPTSVCYRATFDSTEHRNTIFRHSVMGYRTSFIVLCLLLSIPFHLSKLGFKYLVIITQSICSLCEEYFTSLCGTLPLCPSQYTTNPIVIVTLKIWAQIYGSYVYVARKGLHCLEDLYVDGPFASFDQLRATFVLNNSDIFQILPIRALWGSILLHDLKSYLPLAQIIYSWLIP